MGGGSKTTSKSYSGSGQEWAKPYAIQGAGEVFNAYNAAKPTLDAATQNATALAKSGAHSLGATQGIFNSANKMTSDILGGKYLSQGNPYLQQIIDAASRDVRNGVSSQFEQAGRYGSGAYADVLSRNLGDMAAQVRYGNYDDEMSRMMQAASLAYGAQDTASDNALAATAAQAEIPYRGMDSLASSLGSLFSGGTETQKTKGPGLLQGLLGAGAQIGSAAITKYSDIRLKDNIAYLGQAEDGLGVYEWTYRQDMGIDLPVGRFRGFMAQEVAEKRPDALGPLWNGYLTVDYSRLSRDMETVA